MVDLAKRGILGVFAVLLLALTGASPAFAEVPWWGLTSSARPTNLSAGPARDEVQQLTVEATEGKFALVEVNNSEKNLEHKTILPYNATAAEVQQHLEAEVYPFRKVMVTGGYDEATGTGSYEITFPDQAVEPMFALGATVTELAHGEANREIVVNAENLGDGEVNGAGTPVTIADRLPPGLSATSIEGVAYQPTGRPQLECSIASLECKFPGALEPYENIEVIISVKVDGAMSGEDNKATVVGGGAAGTVARQPLTISGEPTPFGVEQYALAVEEEGGGPDIRAGSHPFQVTTTLAFSQTADPLRPPAPPKDVRVDLPPGLIGNPSAVPQCTELQFYTSRPGGTDFCPANTAIGVATATFSLHGLSTAEFPVFNLTPARGEPARFGFIVEGSPVLLNTSIRTGEDYGVVLTTNNLTQLVGLISSRVTLWGVPDDPRHDASRGWECIAGGHDHAEGSPACTPLGLSSPPAFLTLPTSCSGPLQTTVQADSWNEPGNFLTPTAYSFPQDGAGDTFGMGDCNRLVFSPSTEVASDGHAASTPTGLTVGVHVPQEISLNPEGLAESDVKNTTVTLPEGMQLSPSGGNGLQACSDSQIGFTGVKELDPLTEPGVKTGQFTPTQPSCPDASKIATVKIKTPLLPNPLEGAVYLAAPQNFAGPPLENPFGSLIAMYLVAEDPVSGVLVKLPGKVVPNLETGQIVTTFENTPQLPFEDLELHFFGGERAPLSTPALCGSYTTQASFSSWSGNASVGASSDFDITSGPNGVPCSDPQPFAPGFQAGATNLQAGAFTPFTLTMTRPDVDQTLGRIEIHMPPGFSGDLSSVKLCGEPQASQGTCGAESLIGETVVSAGLGGDPYTVTGGKVYITTAYGGGQYGLSIVNPAAAGPFVLNEGRPIIVRAAIYVDPHTAALRIVSDPLPTILDGIPLQIQHVNVTINRPGFAFNPTNCGKMAITGAIDSSKGATAAVLTPFQVTNCATLAFKPKLVASTSGKTSKANGASLTVKLTYPNTPQGSEANIAKVKVDLPKQLPSRLTTLQKACTAAVFEANPANCPAASIVGHAKAITPIIPVPLEGPAYFVSHGGEAFPSLIMVLQGYGVTVDLVGTTFISKAGITSSTFETVPDVPVGSFELTLPEGKFSALAANLPANAKRSLCGQKLAMPTAFLGQNGAEIHESTKIAVSDCAKVKTATRAQKLVAALKACKKDKSKGKRTECQATARKKYGPLKKQGKSKKRK
jgi:hypothetical protein